MDEKVEKFINREEPLEIAHESIAKAAKLLIQNDTPLSKHQAYRNMKEISSEYDYILKCSSNSEIPKPHGIKLQDNVDAYFYAMLYPPIFEVCSNTSKDLMYSKSILQVLCKYKIVQKNLFKWTELNSVRFYVIRKISTCQ